MTTKISNIRLEGKSIYTTNVSDSFLNEFKSYIEDTFDVEDLYTFNSKLTLKNKWANDFKHASHISISFEFDKMINNEVLVNLVVVPYKK